MHTDISVYPHTIRKKSLRIPRNISYIDAVDALPDTKVFQAGTKREGSRTLSSGGRVLCVTALGKGLAEAQKRAYEAVAKIDMEKSQHRSDIGAKGLRRL